MLVGDGGDDAGQRQLRELKNSIAARTIARDLGINFPSTARVTESSLVELIIRSGTFPKGLLDLFVVAKVAHTLPSFIPCLLSSLFDSCASKANSSAARCLGAFLPLAALVLGRHEIAIPSEKVPSVVSAQSLPDATILCGALLYCGVPFSLLSGAISSFRGEMCRAVESWNVERAIVVTALAQELLRMPCVSPYVSAESSPNPKFPSADLQASPDASVKSAPGSPTSREMGEVRDPSVEPSLSAPAPTSSSSLSFPNKLPVTPDFPSSAIVGSLVLCSKELPFSAISVLAVWCLRALAATHAPITAVSLTFLFATYPSQLRRALVAGQRFYEVVFRAALNVAVSTHSACSVSEYCLTVTPFLHLALSCIHVGVRNLLSKESQNDLGDALKHFVRWYLAHCITFDVDEKAASFDHPLRTIMACADAVLHDYAAGSPEHLRLKLMYVKPLLGRLEGMNVHIDLVETLLAAADPDLTGAATPPVTLAGCLPCRRDDSRWSMIHLSCCAWAVDVTHEALLVEWGSTALRAAAPHLQLSEPRFDVHPRFPMQL